MNAAKCRAIFETLREVTPAPTTELEYSSPFELLIIPRHHELHLQDADDETLEATGRAIRDAVINLRDALGDVAYNVVFHTAPHQHSGEYHWHIHLLPKLVTTAGFEAGTGVLINIVSPEQATDALRRVSVRA